MRTQEPSNCHPLSPSSSAGIRPNRTHPPTCPTTVPSRLPSRHNILVLAQACKKSFGNFPAGGFAPITAPKNLGRDFKVRLVAARSLDNVLLSGGGGEEQCSIVNKRAYLLPLDRATCSCTIRTSEPRTSSIAPHPPSRTPAPDQSPPASAPLLPRTSLLAHLPILTIPT